MSALALIALYLVAWWVSYELLEDTWRNDNDLKASDQRFCVVLGAGCALIAGLPALAIWLMERSKDRHRDRVVKPKKSGRVATERGRKA